MPACTIGIRGWHWWAALSWALENAHQQHLWPQNAPSPSHDNQKRPQKLPDDLNLGDKIDIFWSIDTFVHLGPNDSKAGRIHPRKETLRALFLPHAELSSAVLVSTAQHSKPVMCTPVPPLSLISSHSGHHRAVSTLLSTVCTAQRALVSALFSALSALHSGLSSAISSQHCLHCTAGSDQRSPLGTVCTAQQALTSALVSALSALHSRL